VVLSFHDSILLRNTRGRELLINTMLKTKLVESGILELGPIVTVKGFQAVGMLIVQPQSQAPKVVKHFILAFQEENPRVTRIIVNDDRYIPLATHGANREGPTVSIWSNCPGCSVIMVLIGECEVTIILP
jgi:hypothetical protein